MKLLIFSLSTSSSALKCEQLLLFHDVMHHGMEVIRNSQQSASLQNLKHIIYPKHCTFEISLRDDTSKTC